MGKSTPGYELSEDGDAFGEEHGDELAAGDRVDQFEVIRLLGRGGMGEIYAARDTTLGRKVALKLVHQKYLDSPQAMDSFLDEARITAKFNHPNIVTIHAVGAHCGRPYLALEFLEGENLRERIVSRRPGLQASLRILLAIADALEEAHDAGVLHLDLKPENVVIPKDGRVRVVDFGLARPAPQLQSGEVSTAPTDSEADKAAQPVAWGTPAYMAPEQWLRLPCSNATDVWALGLILYEMVSDVLPYELETSGAGLMRAVCDPEPVPPVERYCDVPRDVAELIQRCLDKEPKKRPSASEVGNGLRELLYTDRTRPTDEEGPFRGLLPFTERHAHLFFGREAEIAAFVERLRLQPVLPVVGASGAGKSSFVQAGVLPRLREHEPWLFLKMRPGNRPFDTLAGRLLRTEQETITMPAPADGELLSIPPPGNNPLAAADAQRLADRLMEDPFALSRRLREMARQQRAKVLLLVDQLEELFTLVDDEAERTAFMEALCCAADDPLDPVRVVFTVRDDFLGRIATADGERGVAQVLTQVTVIRSLGPAGMADALVRPLSQVGYHFEDEDMPREMVSAVQAEIAGLPLLQFAAQLLWEGRDKVERVLLRERYEQIGGVEGALARHADGVLDMLSSDELDVARELLLRLVTPERTRRRCAKTTALDGMGEAGRAVLSRLTSARLITVSKRGRKKRAEAMLEIAHESLIGSGGTLARWVDESREELTFLRDIGQAAELWDKRGRRVEELWHGRALDEALRSIERSTRDVPGLVRQFVNDAQGREIRRRQRRRLALGAVVGLSITIAAAALVVAWFVAEKEREAVTQRDKADRQRAAALREGSRAALGQQAMLEARAKLRLALEVEDHPSARALWWQLSSDPLLWKRDLDERLFAATFSPDGQTVAVASHAKAVFLFDTETANARVLLGSREAVTDVSFSPDGGHIAASNYDGEALIWEIASGRLVRSMKGNHERSFGLRYSPDGRMLVAGSEDAKVRIWDAHSGKLLQLLEGHRGIVGGVAFSSDSRTVASASLDGSVRIWDVATGRQQRIIEDEDGIPRAVLFGPRGKLFFTAGMGKAIHAWDTSSWKKVRSFRGHDAPIARVSIDADGHLLASCADDGTVRLWDVDTGKARAVLRGHDDTTWGIGLSPDGRRVVSASFDHTVRVWDTEGGSSQGSKNSDMGGLRGLAFSPDGKLVAAGSYDARLRIWDVARGVLLRTLSGHTSMLFDVNFSHDGNLLASSSTDWSVRLWDPHTGVQKRVLSGHSGEVTSTSFSPDDKRLATAGSDSQVRIWDLESGSYQALSDHHGPVADAVFSADGKLLATSGDDKLIRIWDGDTGALKQRLSGHSNRVVGLSFSPDGESLASGGVDRTVRLWDLDNGSHEIIGRHPARVYWLSFHPDGKRIGAPGSDGVARLWDIASKRAVELIGHEDEVNNVVFTTDGKLAATSGDDGTLRLWHADSGRPYWHAPALLQAPPRLYSQRGWTTLDGSPKSATRMPRFSAGIEERARRVSQSPNGKLACMTTHQGAIELWDLAADERLRVEPSAAAGRAIAHNDGCVVASEGRASLYGRSGKALPLATEKSVTALGVGAKELFVAAGNEVHLFDQRGTLRGGTSGRDAITAVAVTGTGIAVGHRDGSIEMLPPPNDATKKPASPVFQQVPSSSPLQILTGPMETLFVGYANGVVGMWNTSDGALLARARLHGKLIHLLVEGRRLYAATDLGAHLVWELDSFYEEYCTLLRQVWAHVPAAWVSGRPELRATPSAHECVGE
jgi:WD40 repeat protein/serine/threonine protein kinase